MKFKSVKQFREDFQGNENQKAVFVIYPWRYATEEEGGRGFFTGHTDMVFLEEDKKAARDYMHKKQREEGHPSYDREGWTWTIQRMPLGGKQLPFSNADIYAAYLIIDKDEKKAANWYEHHKDMKSILKEFDMIKEQVDKEGNQG